VRDVTRILNAIERGDARAVDKLLPIVYEELRLLAAQRLSRELPGQTLQPTALVHEAYLRLVEDEPQNWNSRGHFFSAAAEAMRRILIENARRKQRLKRGSQRQRVNLHDEVLAIEEPSDDLIALDEALTKLAETDKTKAELVKLRYFAGLTLEQAAELLDISPTTAKRYWTYAKAWLYGAIRSGD
jgi:RNA polymerase sigma factor (TIGR02999 family)